MKKIRSKNYAATAKIFLFFVLICLAFSSTSKAKTSSSDLDSARSLDEARADLSTLKKQESQYCKTSNGEAPNDAPIEECTNLSLKIGRLENRIKDLERSFKTENQALSDCNNRNAAIKRQNGTGKDLYVWEDGECRDLAKNPRTDDEDCGNASQFEGRLKGENCRKAATTIKDVAARNQTVNETTTMAATAFSQLTAAKATGQQSDAQKSQQNLLQGLALAKVASSASLISGAGQLKTAASGAEDASIKMASAYKAISDECAAEKDPALKESEEACFYAKAPAHNVPVTKLEYTNYDRLKSGAGQSQDQADRANALYKSSTISGLADAFVGYQAMQAANQAKQRTGSLASIPPPPTYLLGTSGSSIQPGVGGINAVTNPTDYTTGGDGALLGNVAGGPVGGSLMPGRSFQQGTFKSANSGVSGSSGGGRGAGGGAPAAPNSGKSKSRNGGPSGVGEYNLGGGQLQNPKVDNKNAGDANNPFADALAKLFPTDKDGKPVVEGSRDLASAGANNNGEGEDQNMPDTSIFDQVTIKIRQLTNSGRI